MSETILLVIFAIAILGLIWGARRIIASRQMKPLTSKVEAAIRIVLCVVFALIAYAIYHTIGNNVLTDAVSVLASALIIYAVTHLADRFVLK